MGERRHPRGPCGFVAAPALTLALVLGGLAQAASAADHTSVAQPSPAGQHKPPPGRHKPPAGGNRGGRAVGYAGRTSQGLPISFTRVGSSITDLRFVIQAACPSGRTWDITAYGFPPIKIAGSRFAIAFGSNTPSAMAKVSGTVRGGTVSGKASIKRFIAAEHHYCRGSATFRLDRSD